MAAVAAVRHIVPDRGSHPAGYCPGGTPLAISTLGKGRDRHHLAVIPFAAQPAEEGTLEELGVQPVGLGTPVLTRHCHAGSVDDMRLGDEDRFSSSGNATLT
jgi:hypothetical protein